MKRERAHGDLPDRDDGDRDLRKRFASLAKVKAPENAVEGIYARVERLTREAEPPERSPTGEKQPGFSGVGSFFARFLPSFAPARAALLASLLTLCVAAPAAFFIGLSARRQTTAPEKLFVVRLVFDHRDAARVAVIGDFNNWQKGAAEMRRVPGTSLWAIEIPLEEGLYRYAFLIDEKEWKADPLARVTLKDDFGKDNSLIVLTNQGEEARL
jgi:hypothetical protein